MAYTDAEARQELLDDVATAVDALALALAELTVAYEELDDATADRLEAELFAVVQSAYGKAKRTHAGFAERHGLPARAFTAPGAGHSHDGAKGRISAAVVAARRAADNLAALQDSMRPVEVGDAELRAGLAEVRELAGQLPGRAREIVRILGR